MAPRISMLTGVDSLGNLYVSLTQSNSNKSMMSIFFQQLVLTLNKERPDWRRNTIVTMDGAAYHAADTTYNLLKKLRVPVMMQGPHR